MRADHVSADQRFASALYLQLASAQGNLVFSPASIRVALAMATLGARGETAAQMARALAFTGKDDHEDLAAVLTEWRARAEIATASGMPEWERNQRERRREVLRVVNRLWAQTGYALRPELAQSLQTFYASSIELLDFAGNREGSRLAINDWVKAQTEDRIVDLLSPMHVRSDTRMILTNAVYLKALWEHEFNDWATVDGPFWTSAGSSVPARLMSQTETFGYADRQDCQILELPYASGKLGMIVVLPRARDGLPLLEQALARSGLGPWLVERRPTFTHVVLPRFRATSALSLRTALEGMGIALAFRPESADFSSIDGTRELVLSDAIHQAFIAVDEKGTEAAAATAAVLLSSCIPQARPQPREFRADHPFLFLLWDRENGRIVFMGRVVDPRESRAC
jgi:serpin B